MTAGVTVTALALGSSHTCAATSDGRASCWGSNSSGQLGAGGTVGDQDRPVRVALGSGAA